MQNKHPKSEMPALKEAAAAAKDKQALQKSSEKEKKQHEKVPHAIPGRNASTPPN